MVRFPYAGTETSDAIDSVGVGAAFSRHGGGRRGLTAGTTILAVCRGAAGDNVR